MKRRQRRSPVRRFFYGLRYRVGEFLLRRFVQILPHIPTRLALAYMSFMARLTYMLLWKYRKRMEENLASVFANDLSPRERKAMVWAAWLSFARGVLDTILVMYYSRERIVATIALEGEEHIQRALQQGKGVLALSAHLGTFTLIGARLAAGGFPFSVVVKQPADEGLARLIDGYRTQVGIHTISAKPRREAVRGILKALRKNHIVLVIADEFKSGNLKVDFLGLKVSAPRGPATLALRTGAVTLPMFATRQPDDSLRLSVGAPIAPVEREDLEESAVATTALFTTYIEAAIRKYPEQWNWLGLRRHNGKISRAEIARLRKTACVNASRVSTRANRVGNSTSSS